MFTSWRLLTGFTLRTDIWDRYLFAVKKKTKNTMKLFVFKFEQSLMQ